MPLKIASLEKRLANLSELQEALEPAMDADIEWPQLSFYKYVST